MTIKSTCFSAAVAAGLLLPAVALPAGAFAQTQTPVPGAGNTPVPGGTVTPGPGGTPTHKPKAAGHQAASQTEGIEEHINELHTQLLITPEQQPQWDPFAQVMRDNAKAMQQTLQQRGTTFASLSAVDNLQSYARIAQQHAEDTQKLAAAFQTLYGSMSDEQKKNADTVFRARGDQAGRGHRKG